MNRPAAVPADVWAGEDMFPQTPRVLARLLGRGGGTAVDGAAAHAIQAADPGLAQCLREAHRFRMRAVAEMARRGCAQFLAVGCGPATPAGLHRIVARYRAGARMVYVEGDPAAVAQINGVLACAAVPGVRCLQAEVTHPAAVFRAPGVREMLSLHRPVGLVLGILDSSPGLNTRTITGGYLAGLAAGSMVAVTARTLDGLEPDTAQLRRDTATLHELPWTWLDRGTVTGHLARVQLWGLGVASARNWHLPGGNADGAPPGVYAAAGSLR